MIENNIRFYSPEYNSELTFRQFSTNQQLAVVN